jgi:hypothetical protein
MEVEVTNIPFLFLILEYSCCFIIKSPGILVEKVPRSMNPICSEKRLCDFMPFLKNPRVAISSIRETCISPGDICIFHSKINDTMMDDGYSTQ